MYRMLIVDDEPAIVEGLAQLFEASGMELDVWKATSADEALHVARQMKLDLVLSDIRMPEKNGLQLTDELLLYWPSCKILFLTGYSEFDYAYAAFQKNVEAYILKHEDDAKVLAAVRAVVGKLDEERRNGELIARAMAQAASVRPLVRQSYLDAVLSGEPARELLLLEPFDDLPLRLGRDVPVMLLAGFVRKWSGEAAGHGSPLQACYAVQTVFREALTPLLTVEELVYERSALVWLIQPNPETDRLAKPDRTPDWRATAAYLKGILESVQNTCQDTLDVEVTFVLGRDGLAWDDVHREFEAMRAWMKQRDRLTPNMTIVDMRAASDPQSERSGARLSDAGQPDGQRSEAGEHALVEKIHQFIEGHLGEDLSLIRLADIVYMNPSYFSRYYKQQTGRNVSEYIQAARLQAAKAMLEDGREKVQDIAQRLGFASASYFSIFFRKMTGMTPQEYRERL